MMEVYYSLATRYWRSHLEEPDEEKYEKFKHKLQGFLPVTDILYINSIEELALTEENGGFVIITMFQKYPGENPFSLYVNGDMRLLMSEYKDGAWCATYAKEIKDDDD